jgi:hypothetical protein
MNGTVTIGAFTITVTGKTTLLRGRKPPARSVTSSARRRGGCSRSETAGASGPTGSPQPTTCSPAPAGISGSNPSPAARRHRTTSSSNGWRDANFDRWGADARHFFGYGDDWFDRFNNELKNRAVSGSRRSSCTPARRAA